MSRNRRNNEAANQHATINIVRTAKTEDKPSKNRRRRRKPSSSNSNPVSTDSIESNGKVMNNPNFYFTDATLASQATSISFDTFLGTEDNYGGEGSTGVNKTPTMMLIHTMPTAGPMNGSYSGLAGINMAGRKLYTRLSSINAKTTNYAPQDLITLMLALGSVLEMISFIRRAFGLAFVASYRNRIVPKEILKMMGIDADDFFKNVSAYRLEFNTLINMMMKIPFPSNVAYFEKCATMHDHIWTDSEDMAIAQLYATAPLYLWKFNEQYSEQGTGLDTLNLSTHGNSIKQMAIYLGMLGDMIEQLMTSSTLNFIYADILNLAAKENVPLYQVTFVPENYVVVPEYNAEALLQIHNITITGEPEATNPAEFTNWTPNNDVVPDVNKNCIRYYPSFISNDAILNTQKLIDFPNGNPDTAQIIEATRYTAAASDASIVSDSYHVTGLAFGDHVAVRILVYFLDATVSTDYIVSSSSIAVNSAKLWPVTSAFSKFDWCPILCGASATDKTKFVDVFGDLNYYTFVDYSYLQRINDLAMMALFELR